MAAAAIAGATLVTVATGGTPSAVAAPNALNVSAGSVAVGSTITATPSGCPRSADGSGTFVQPEIELIAGSGPSARLAAVGVGASDGSYELSVPGWVDPAQPAVVAGRCAVTTVAADGTQSFTTRLTYADVAVDITPGPAYTPAPTITLDRSTAAAGQIITVAATGCEPNSLIQAILLDGSDLSGRGSQRFVVTGTTDGFTPSPSGSANLELELNIPPLPVGVPAARGAHAAAPTRAVERQPDGGPLPEGSYIALVACRGPKGPLFIAEPKPVQVVGTNPTDSLVVEPSADGVTAVVSGHGCTGGRRVTLTTKVSAFSAGPSDGVSEPEVTTSAVTPGPDGSWSHTLDLPAADSFSGLVAADCGDPHADGFRYVGRSIGGGTAPGPPVVPAPPPSTPPVPPVPSTPNPPSTPSVPSAPGAPALPGQGTYTG